MKKIIYIKYLKVIAITMVCSYHFLWSTDIYATEKLVGNFLSYNHFSRFIFSLCTICVPLFFMCNGALLLHRDLNIKKHIKSTKKVFAYYVLFNLVLFLTYTTYHGISLELYGFRNFINFVLFNSLPDFPVNHLWFARVLLTLYLIFPFIKISYDVILDSDWKCVKKYSIVLGIIVVFILNSANLTVILRLFIPSFGNLSLKGLQTFLPFNNQLNIMLIYFILGGIIHKYMYDNNLIREIKSYIIIFVYLISSFFIYFFWTYNGFNGIKFYDVIFDNYGTIFGFISSISFYLLFIKLESLNKLEDSKVISIISDNTFEVYFIHWILGVTVMPAIYLQIYQMKNGNVPYYVNLIKSLLLVVTISFISYELKRILKMFNDLFRKSL